MSHGTWPGVGVVRGTPLKLLSERYSDDNPQDETI